MGHEVKTAIWTGCETTTVSTTPASSATTDAGSQRIAAVVLTGGAGLRLGGVDKATLRIGGRTLLERALTVTALAEEVVVVGEQLPTSREVLWTREDPPGGGPAAGLLAGVDALGVRPDLVCVLAVDMPGVSPSTFDRLVAAVQADRDADAAVVVDETGRQQMLAGTYRHGALSRARPGERAREAGLSMRSLIAGLRILEVPAVADEARDVDTRADLDAFGGQQP